MFYELQHPMDADYFKIEFARDMSFPQHIHHCFELVVLLDGMMSVQVDAAEYTLHPGEGALIFPNQIHSLRTVGTSRHVLCVFSPQLVNTYYGERKGQLPEHNQFVPESFYVEKMCRLSRMDSISRVKGILYALCSDFDEEAVYRPAAMGGKQDQLLNKIFSYIESHYREECTLRQLSGAIAYDYAYLSKFFKRTVGIPYNDYVNQYRISEGCRLLRTTNRTVLEISMECGYKNLRSFNRNFKEQMGCTPATYRKLEPTAGDRQG